MGGVTVVSRDMGSHGVPQDILRLRRSVYEMMRRMGSPIVIKHMFNAEDVNAGVAQPSPVFDDIYGQTRNRDPLSHGIGYCSVELSEDEWYNSTTGEIQIDDGNGPGAGWVRAPKYRGFGPGYLTYIIEPDRAEDYFKLNPQGVLFKVQTATAVAPWYPDINDNDLLINVTLDKYGRILTTHERYQAKMTQPVSIRGLDRRGRREYSGDIGNRHVVNQQFEMTLIPDNDEMIEVEVDR